MDFNRLMQTAAHIKGEQMKSDRRGFEDYPSFIQNTYFHCEPNFDVKMREPDVDLKTRLAYASERKEAGNALLATQDFLSAQHKYEEALSVFWWCTPLNEDWRNEGIQDKFTKYFEDKGEGYDDMADRERVQHFKASILCNMAVCQLRQATHASFALCVKACEFAIKTDDACAKAYYLRAQARLRSPSSGATEFDWALADLKKANKLKPADKGIRKALADLKQELKEMRNKNSKQFGKMFSTHKGSIYDGVESRSVPTEDELRKAKEKEVDWFADKDPSVVEQKKADTFHARIQEAEMLARYYDREGKYAEADETREKIKKAITEFRKAREQKMDNVDWLNPTPEMIADAKTKGIDLNDQAVRQYMAHLDDMRKKHPDMDHDSFMKMSNEELQKTQKEMEELEKKRGKNGGQSTWSTIIWFVVLFFGLLYLNNMSKLFIGPRGFLGYGANLLFGAPAGEEEQSDAIDPAELEANEGFYEEL